MENASKALIIAGAILLSILIISLGIMIYNQASGVVDSGAMDEVAVTTFNQKFQQYEGQNVRGAQVNALINAVIQNNISNNNDASKQIIIKSGSYGPQVVPLAVNSNWLGTNPGTDPKIAQTSTSETGKAMTGKTYQVTCSTSATGYINEITISGK